MSILIRIYLYRYFTTSYMTYTEKYIETIGIPDNIVLWDAIPKNMLLVFQVFTIVILSKVYVFANIFKIRGTHNYSLLETILI